MEAGFSGADITADSKRIIVTASVENTDNAYDDGEILGSYIGVLPIKNGQPQEVIHWTAINNEGQALKVESISILNEQHTDYLQVMMVTDSDGKGSFAVKGKIFS